MFMTKLVRSLSLVAITAVLHACGGSGPATQPNGTAPVITSQPAAVTVASGAAATFSVAATGAPTPAYQWKRNGTDIGGATGATYAIPAVASTDNGAKFSVTATNGIGVATSNEALLTVNYAPTIVTQPAAQTTFVGLQPVFSVAANGNPLPTYQWKRNGTDIAGATASSYMLSPAAAVGDNGASFTVVVTNAIGSVTSAAAVLTVSAIPSGAPASAPVFTLQPAARSVVETASATFSATATGAVNYQWQKLPVSGAWTDIPGETASTLTLTNIPFSDNGAQYRVNATSAQNVTGASDPALLSVARRLMSIFAGYDGPQGNIDAVVGAQARFSYPSGLATDPNGDTIVADFGNQTIRRIKPSGEVVTVAGTPKIQGYANGPGLGGARFNNPRGVAVNPLTGVIYVADQGNGSIRAIAVDGVVSTLSGNSDTGYVDGLSGDARFNAPKDLAISGTSSTMYVADFNNNRIRKVDLTDGSVTTFAGATPSGSSDGAAIAAARFDGPAGVAVDPGPNAASDADDIVYVADMRNHAIRRIAGGTVTTIAAGQFSSPQGLTLDPVNSLLYVPNSEAHNIRSVYVPANTSDPLFGQVSTVAGLAGAAGSADGTAAARFNLPYGVAVNAAGTELRVSNFNSDTVSAVVVSSPPAVTTAAFAGSAEARGDRNGQGTAARFSFPRGMATGASGPAAGVTFVADSFNNTIRRINASGLTSLYAGITGVGGNVNGAATGEATFNDPRGLAVDSAGVVYVADRSNSAIRRISSDGNTVDTLPIAGIDYPDAVLAAPGGVIYVANTGANTILEVPVLTGVPTRIWGSAVDPGGLVDLPLTNARFNVPSGLALSNNILYVAEQGNRRIRAIDLSNGSVSTVAGADTINVPNYHDDPDGLLAKFENPGHLVVDNQGTYLYIVDYSNSSIRRMTIGGTMHEVTTVLGVSGTLGGSSAVGVKVGAIPSDARLNSPVGISVRPTGPGTQLIVSDGLEHVILSVVLP